ncbi:hypothetical protein SLEP1_g43161 [Rubroshorea leprosula]|uniref:Uncharacterized protein n=1 Tax=Rubroshorea leprosula TaxID=152421 RepID=A0AAV5LC42_9ROSI|nr:hypothetical protein SLEP1_g43161 [Rubroshorea leprosula]
MIHISIGCLSVLWQSSRVAQRKRSKLCSDHGELVKHLFVLDCVKPFTSLDGPQFEFWGQNSFLGGPPNSALFLLLSRPLQLPKAPKLPATIFLRKPVGSLILSFFSCSRTRFRSLKSSPLCRNSRSARFLPSPVCKLQLVGAKFWAFRISPSMPPAFPQIVAPALLAGFMVPNCSVSLALRLSLRLYAI